MCGVPWWHGACVGYVYVDNSGNIVNVCKYDVAHGWPPVDMCSNLAAVGDDVASRTSSATHWHMGSFPVNRPDSTTSQLSGKLETCWGSHSLHNTHIPQPVCPSG